MRRSSYIQALQASHTYVHTLTFSYYVYLFSITHIRTSHIHTLVVENYSNIPFTMSLITMKPYKIFNAYLYYVHYRIRRYDTR